MENQDWSNISRQDYTNAKLPMENQYWSNIFCQCNANANNCQWEPNIDPILPAKKIAMPRLPMAFQYWANMCMLSQKNPLHSENNILKKQIVRINSVLFFSLFVETKDGALK